MVPSIPDYIKYANDVLGPKLPKEVLAKIRAFEAKGDYTNPEYLKIVEDYYYPEHVLRMPPATWPDPVKRAFAKMNYPLYLRMQGPSEFGVVGDAVLKNWDRKADLHNIYRPLLSIGGSLIPWIQKPWKLYLKQYKKGNISIALRVHICLCMMINKLILKD
jgi:proline iminopeptidase